MATGETDEERRKREDRDRARGLIRPDMPSAQSSEPMANPFRLGRKHDVGTLRPTDVIGAPGSVRGLDVQSPRLVTKSAQSFIDDGPNYSARGVSAPVALAPVSPSRERPSIVSGKSNPSMFPSGLSTAERLAEMGISAHPEAARILKGEAGMPESFVGEAKAEWPSGQESYLSPGQNRPDVLPPIRGVQPKEPTELGPGNAEGAATARRATRQSDYATRVRENMARAGQIPGGIRPGELKPDGTRYTQDFADRINIGGMGRDYAFWRGTKYRDRISPQLQEAIKRVNGDDQFRMTYQETVDRTMDNLKIEGMLLENESKRRNQAIHEENQRWAREDRPAELAKKAEDSVRARRDQELQESAAASRANMDVTKYRARLSENNARRLAIEKGDIKNVDTSSPEYVRLDVEHAYLTDSPEAARALYNSRLEQKIANDKEVISLQNQINDNKNRKGSSWFGVGTPYSETARIAENHLATRKAKITTEFGPMPQYEQENHDKIPAPSELPASVPKVGDVDGEFRFKGGDPKKEESWERLKPLGPDYNSEEYLRMKREGTLAEL